MKVLWILSSLFMSALLASVGCGEEEGAECINKCDTPGERSCAGKGRRTCDNIDADPCLEWSDIVECGPNESCRDGSCIYIPECSNETDCDLGKVCTDGQCVSGPGHECEEDSNCEPGETCRDGSCIHTPECTTDTDCDLGKVCTEGQCVPGQGHDCKEDSNCPEGKVCRQGVCICEVPQGPADWISTRIESDEKISFKPSLGVDPCGGVHLAYAEGSGFEAEIYYATNASGSWETTRLTDNEAEDVFPCLKVDPDGVVHITYTHNVEGVADIYYIKNSPGAFSTPLNLTEGSGFVSTRPKHDIGPDGTVHVVFERSLPGNTNYELAYVSIVDGEVDVVEQLTADPGYDWSPDLAVDGNGGIHIAFASTRDGDFEIYYLSNTGAGWNLFQITNNEGVGDDDAAIAIDPAGKVQLMYVGDFFGTPDIYFTNDIGGSFTDPVSVSMTESLNDFICAESMVVDSQRNVYVAYWEFDEAGNADIFVTDNIGGTFSTPENVTNTADVDELHPAFVVDSTGNRHLAYWNGHGEIFYSVKGP